MTPVTIGGMVAGGLLILTTIAVFWTKKEFPGGGVAVTLVGLVLIGMSQWSTIKITMAGASLDLIRSEIRQTAAAAEEIAVQAQQAAASAETTREQVATLARHLETRNVLSAAALRPIRTSLDTAPRVDVSRLRVARENLARITALKPPPAR